MASLQSSRPGAGRLQAVRKTRSAIVMALCFVAAGLGLLALALILGALLWSGFSSISPAVFTQMTPPPGSAGVSSIIGATRKRKKSSEMNESLKRQAPSLSIR